MTRWRYIGGWIVVVLGLACSRSTPTEARPTGTSSVKTSTAAVPRVTHPAAALVKGPPPAPGASPKGAVVGRPESAPWTLSADGKRALADTLEHLVAFDVDSGTRLFRRELKQGACVSPTWSNHRHFIGCAAVEGVQVFDHLGRLHRRVVFEQPGVRYVFDTQKLISTVPELKLEATLLSGERGYAVVLPLGGYEVWGEPPPGALCDHGGFTRPIRTCSGYAKKGLLKQLLSGSGK